VRLKVGCRPQHPRRIPQLRPHIAEAESGRSAGRDGGPHLRLLQRRHVLRQIVPLPEFSERQTRGVVVRCAARQQLPPAVFQVLRELFDDLVLAGRRETQR
jgi:hypothetical protein